MNHEITASVGHIKLTLLLLSYYWPVYTWCRGQYCFARWRLSSSVTLHYAVALYLASCDGFTVS